MELTKELKEKLEKAETKEEAKKIIEDAGMELTDEEIEQVAGGRYYRIKDSEKDSTLHISRF